MWIPDEGSHHISQPTYRFKRSISSRSIRLTQQWHISPIDLEAPHATKSVPKWHPNTDTIQVQPKISIIRYFTTIVLLLL